ncbi:MAG: leucine-rich repeat protein [Lachnospiraceae bacterium]|nr:leucine-rich repeat protein [Lachnospiraceae bacterium]
MKHFSKTLMLLVFLGLFIVAAGTMFASLSISSQAEPIIQDQGQTDEVRWKYDSEGTLTIYGGGKMRDYYKDNIVSSPPWKKYAKEIKKVVVEEGVTYIGAIAFKDMTKINKVILPKSLIEIYKDVNYSPFQNCTQLKTAGPAGGDYDIEFAWDTTIPEKIRFELFPGIEQVVLPSGLKYIPNCCLGGCNYLKTVKMPEKPTSIGDWAFSGCNNLEEIYIPASVTEIGSYAFGYCKKLQEITIPHGVQILEGSVLTDCTSLASISIPYSVTKISEEAFYNCNALKTVYYDGSEDIWNEISIEDSNQPILNASITYGKNAGKCGNNIYWGIYSNSILAVSGNDEMFDYDDSPWKSKGISSVHLDDGITHIGDNSFNGCSSIEIIKLPDSVTSIGNGAFSGCENLSAITIPTNVTSIGENAFAGCSSLAALSIPGGVESIGSDAFSGCEKLKSVGPVGGDYDIQYAWNEAFPANAFSGCSSITKLVIFDGITTIGNAAFAGCEIAEIDIPDSVSKIDAAAFKNCNKVKSIALPDGIETIEKETFKGCAELTTVMIPKSVKLIDEDAFSECNAIFEIYYAGSNEDWDTITIKSGNATLSKSKVKFSEYMYVSFDSNGTTETFSKIGLVYGKVYGNLPSPQARKGYNFLGWSLSKDTKDFVSATMIVSKKENHTLYAIWEPKKLTVSLDPNTGTLNQDIIVLVYDAPYGEIPVPDKTGYDFLGWFTEEKSGTLIEAEKHVDVDENFTLYAHWRPSLYTVTLDYRDGKSSTKEVLVTYDSTYGTLPVPDEMVGYSFKGWFTSLDGDERILDTSVVSIAKNHTLYGRWEANEYILTFNSAGGEVSVGSKIIKYGSVYGELPEPTNGDLIFAGWYTESEGGTLITDETIVDVLENQTLYARWGNSPTYSVTLDYSTVTLETGKNVRLNVKIYPENATNKVLSWTSSDENVVTVSDGLIKAVNPGIAEVTVTTKNGGHSATCIVVVINCDLDLDDEFQTEDDDFEAPDGLWISGLEITYSYTGKKICPTFKVYYRTTLLTEKIDYTVSYKNNTNAGKATITISGKGNYTGKCNKTFSITPLELDEEEIYVVPGIENKGKTVKPVVHVFYNGNALLENKDYIITYNAITSPGATDVSIKGIGNYSGSFVKQFVVKAKTAVDLTKSVVRGLKNSYSLAEIETLKETMSGITVSLSGKVIDASLYEAVFENCDRVGKATLVIKPAEDSEYVGEKRVSFTVTGLKLGSIGITAMPTYNGKLQLPTVLVWTGKKQSGERVPEDAYVLSYSRSAINAGTITITAAGVPEKGYSGSVSAKYIISALPLSSERITVNMPQKVYYSQGAATPLPVITYNNGTKTVTLKEGADYSLSYKNNKSCTGTKVPSVTITGKGNFSGKITKEFAIEKTNINSLIMSCSDVVYKSNKKGSYYCSKPVIYDTNGKALKENADYTVTYIDLSTNEPIDNNKKWEPATDTIIRADIVAKEKNYTGSAHLFYTVKYQIRDLKSAKVAKIADCSYTGKAIEPKALSVTYTVGSGKNKITLSLTEGTDYVIAGYYKNVKRGTASVVIEGRGEYTGTKTINYKIVAANNKNAWRGIFKNGEIVGYAPSSILLSDTTMGVGTKTQLVPTFGPDKCDIPEVTWKSSNTKIATVDKYGNVIAKKKGTVVITVTSMTDKSLTAKATIVVE